jgi:hypothetical protein
MTAWYHGSPLVLEVLASGSTITRNRDLARVFSHRPAIVSWEDDGRLRHTGRQPGYLYVIAEELGPDDVRAHPRSSMPPGAEWLTQRPLRLALLEATAVRPDEFLTDDEVRGLTG